MPLSSLIQSAKNKIKNYTPVQIKTQEATSLDLSGPSQSMLIELAALSYNNVVLNQILEILVKRINDHGKHWRRIFKSLVLFEFLCLHGNEKMLNYCKKHLQKFETLKAFLYFEQDCRENGEY
ncbi:hypothetical protein HZS_4646 [Henneguya salminicola]|nr:hypothetical protein HZS_4646 [Henneguya salminicola]